MRLETVRQKLQVLSQMSRLKRGDFQQKVLLMLSRVSEKLVLNRGSKGTQGRSK